MAEIKIDGKMPDEKLVSEMEETAGSAANANEPEETIEEAFTEETTDPTGEENPDVGATADDEQADDTETEDPQADASQEEAEEAEDADEADPEANAAGVEGGRDSDAEDAGSGEKEGGLKGFFKKKDKKDKKDKQIEELTDRVRRQMAEFDNFRKRTEKEKAAMYEIGAKSVIEKILPVVDNFERGLATAENREDPFVDGMNKIYKQLMTTLESLEVTPIEAVGQEFNPELHNAVMHVDDESVGENMVVEELQKGYKYRDSVVRYSMVKVAN